MAMKRVSELDYLLEEIFTKLQPAIPTVQAILHPTRRPHETNEERANRRALLSLALTSRKLGAIGGRVLWRSLTQKGLAHFVRMMYGYRLSGNIDVSPVSISIPSYLQTSSTARRCLRAIGRRNLRPASGASFTEHSSRFSWKRTACPRNS